MDTTKLAEEKLREASCFGDEEGVRTLVERGVNVNSQHDINGWTALHWAAKRGHCSIVRYLLAHGADKALASARGETAAALTESEEIRKLLSGSPVSLSDCPGSPALPINPNYIVHPSLAYKVELGDSGHGDNRVADTRYHSIGESPGHDYELVVKVRVANCPDQDFIEVEVPYSQLAYSTLLKICCDELKVNMQKVIKFRKLPNTILRKDKDVLRLRDFQELEIVLHTDKQAGAPGSPNYRWNNTTSLSPPVNGTYAVNLSSLPSGYMNVNHSPPASKSLLEKSNYCKNGTILY